MPTTSAGIYELILKQTFQGQVVINVFHYLHTLGNDDEQEDCGQAFVDDVNPEIATIQSDNLDYTDVQCKNLTGTLADSSTQPAPISGGQTGDEASSYVSAPFRYNRVTKDTRNGAKRFCGMLEQNLLTTGFTAGYVGLLNALAVILGNNISVVGAIFEPIILRKPPTEAGVYTYNTISSVKALNRSTTQNSRKVF